MIYLDNAATTLHKPDVVGQAVAEALCTMGNSGRGAHAQALSASSVIYETRSLLAEFFGLGNPKQVAFTPNSTAALNIAVKGSFNPGDHVITTVIEHNSVLRPLYEMEKQGVELSFVGCDENGAVRAEDFELLIKSNTKGIVCTHASNLTGNLIDIAAVGKITREHDLRFIVDASQTAGVFPIDMKKMNIDILCFTGHKGLMGPQGTGGLCVREGVSVRPLLSGGSGVESFSHTHPTSMPTVLEAGTLNGHGIAGLNAAVKFIRETGLDRIHEKEQALMRRFYNGVKDIPDIKIYGDFLGTDKAAIVALNIADEDSAEISDILFTDYDISTRPGAHCAPLIHEHFGTKEQGIVRFSFAYFNTEEEVDAAIQALFELTEV